MNNYEVPEVVELGKPEDVILGSTKPLPLFHDSPSQVWRDVEVDEK